MNAKRQALVIGANGVIGRRLIEELIDQGWQVVGVSRRGGEPAPGVRHLQVDLLNAAATRDALRPLSAISHVFYAAYQDAPDWAGLVAPNLQMLQHVVEGLEPIAPALEHISLMQGYKVYGAHLGPFKTPARESDAGHMPPEFNAAQQQYLEQRQTGKRWRWSAIRPSVVGGFSLGNPMNLALSIAVYASISKALGLPLRFPGKPGAYHSLLEMTDAGLLARATLWAATEPAAANQAFNINNGDLFRWSEMWPKIAAVARAGATALLDRARLPGGGRLAFRRFRLFLGLRHVRGRQQGAAFRFPSVCRNRGHVFLAVRCIPPSPHHSLNAA